MERLIDLAEVKRMTSLSRSIIYRLEGAGEFPKRVALSDRVTRWVASEVEAWVQRKIEHRQLASAARQEVGMRLVRARRDKPWPG